MKPSIKSDYYPFFEPNQVLSADNLNQVIDYLDEQERLTRANLIGIGIVCGLELSMGYDDESNLAINISKGCGITSEGYLIAEPEDQCLISFRKYTQPENNIYTDFMKGPEKSEQIDIWELFPDGEPDTTLLGSFEESLNDKAVLLFLELNKSSERNCLPHNCDDNGAKVTTTIRRLLVRNTDLDRIIEDAAELESGLSNVELADTFSERLELDDISLPRFDVPASQITTSTDVIRAFHNFLKNKGIPSNFASALSNAYETFNPLLQDICQDNPFDDFNSKFDFLNMAFENLDPDQRCFLQYYCDFFGDIIKAYDEFRWNGLDLICTCCPLDKLFSRHLILGSLFPPENEPETCRQYFIPSPIISGYEEQLKEFKRLFQRLMLMIGSFTNTPISPQSPAENEIDEQIRITPSRFGDVPLSKKAIPYYYAQDGTPPLYELWSSEKTQLERANQNLCYHSVEYDPSAPDFIINSLSYNLEPYDFIRIEGHLGKDYQSVANTLLSYKQRYRLPIDYVVLHTGEEGPGNFKDFVKTHPGIQHKAGVPFGGTFVLVYHKDGDVTANPEITENSVIADFYLPYQICKYDIRVRQCEYKWIDSILHLNNLSLREYRARKQPRAREFERERLKANYVIRVYKYEIQKRSLISGPVDIQIPISEIREKKISAIASELNKQFPFGLVFDALPDENKILVRHIEGHSYRIELGGIQGNQIRYAFENGKVYRWQDNLWEEMEPASASETKCYILGDAYREEDYQSIHLQYQPEYPLPNYSPNTKDMITWQKATLARARKYKDAHSLPIYNPLLENILNEIKQIDSSAQVVLIGSWANGSWVSSNPDDNEHDNEVLSFYGINNQTEFLKLRRKVTGKAGFSDIDLMVESNKKITASMIKISTEYNVNIISGKRDAQKGLVLL